MKLFTSVCCSGGYTLMFSHHPRFRFKSLLKILIAVLFSNAFLAACDLHAQAENVGKFMPRGYPDYWLGASVDLFTGAISIVAAFFLWKLIPRVLTLRSPADWQRVNEELRDNETRIRELNEQLKERARQQEILNEELAKMTESAQTARDQAIEASKFKTAFLANMSHEIRTPMNGIFGMTDLLSRTPLSDVQKDYVETIQEAGKSLLSLINEVLDFARIEAGKMTIEIVSFDTVLLVEGVGELMASDSKAKNLSLMTYVDPRIPSRLLGDPGRLRQILVNLVGNAVKFSEHGEVVLRATLESGAVRSADRKVTVRFTVTDCGIGISESQKELLFKPFVQADGSMSRKYGGTGLGLAISRHLVDLMGGEIGVMSAPGEGSTFWFTVTFDVKEEQQSHSVDDGTLKKARVLIVDDEVNAREIAHAYLDSWSVRNDVADSGAEAIEMIHRAAAENDPYMLAIVDLAMPDMSGFDLGRVLRENAKFRDLKLVLITAHGTQITGEESFIRGFDGYLAKPLRQSQLFDCLVAALNGRKRQRMRPDSAMLHDETHNHSVKPRRGELLLVVEDHPVNQRVALSILNEFGFEAHVVSNGVEALEAISQVPYSLAFMDIQMPVMDGLEATREIRKDETHTGKHMPIIAMTAHALESSREECISAGMDDYVSKPIDRERISVVLDKWIPHTVSHNGSDYIDVDKFKRVYGGGDWETMIEVFLTEAPADIGKIKEAFDKRSAAELLKSAHSFKGACGTMCAHSLQSRLLKLEETARQVDWEAAEKLIDEIELEFRNLKVYVRELFLAGGEK